MQGNCISKDLLLEAGADSCDLLIAVTAHDEVNMLCCMLTKKLGTRHTIARVRNPEYADEIRLFASDMGLSMTINPEYSAAQEIFSVLRFPGLLSIEEFGHGKFELAEFKLTKESPLTSVSLEALSRKYHSKALVCAVRRDKETIIPNGQLQLQVGDRISFAAEPVEAERFLQLAGVQSRMPRHVIIIGAGRITYYLLRMMKKVGMRAVVIEQNEKRARELNRAFPGTLVICADGTNRDVLEEEGVSSCDAFVSMTGTDEVNILLAMYADGMDVPKVVAKVSRYEAMDLVADRTAGSIVLPSDIVASRVISYVRAMEKAGASNVETLYRVVDNTVEALEFVVRESNRELTGVPLKQMRLRKNLLVCAILRAGKVIIAGGDDYFLPGDRVIIVTTNKYLNDLTNILE
jgi:trk system potassium uptake protein TrkA